MKLLYTGSYCEENEFAHIFTHQKNPPSMAQQKLEGLLLQGYMENGCNVYALLMPPVRSFPGNRLIIKGKKTANRRHLGMLNILIIKQLWIFFYAFFCCLSYLLRTPGRKVYFSYSVNPPLTLPCLFLCKLFHVKTCLYVSELPHLRTFHGQTSFLRRVLLRLHTAVSVRIHRSFDAYVPITQAAGDAINPLNRPQVVVEGMTDRLPEGIIPPKEASFTVLYAGGLNKNNGVMHLLEGFLAFNEPTAKLWFFGSGDCDIAMQTQAKEDARITFFGNRPNEEVVKKQQQATLLINPRPTDAAFNAYSFPSKTIESMASGTPLLTTRLAGIPEAYFEYCYILQDERAEGITHMLEELYQKRHELADMGKRGQDFILLQKTYTAQTARIVQMLEQLH